MKKLFFEIINGSVPNWVAWNICVLTAVIVWIICSSMSYNDAQARVRESWHNDCVRVCGVTDTVFREDHVIEQCVCGDKRIFRSKMVLQVPFKLDD